LAIDDFDRQRGQFTGHVYDHTIAQALQIFQDFAVSPECQILRSGRSPGQLIGRLECLLAQGPGCRGSTIWR
jgi:hypothetical protein